MKAQNDAFLEMLRDAPIDADDSSLARVLTDTLNLAPRDGLFAYDAVRPEGFTAPLRCWPPHRGVADALRKSATCSHADAWWSNAPTSSGVLNPTRGAGDTQKGQSFD